MPGNPFPARMNNCPLQNDVPILLRRCKQKNRPLLISQSFPATWVHMFFYDCPTGVT